jgi:cyclic pyranopterin monophosphate synthase
MVDITHKSYSLRTAVASATLVCSSAETILSIQEKRVPKGDVFEFARAAGLLAIKKTSDVIPDCHPMPIEHATIQYSIDGLSIQITVTVTTIYKTGVEVEAMHGASIVALTMYDMLKPIDKQLEIKSIKLIEKKGGKSDFKNELNTPIQTAVIVCSDSISKKLKEDKAGLAIIAELKKSDVEVTHYVIIPDDKIQIENALKHCLTEGFQLVIFTGGTGLSPKDITPETIAPFIDTPIPGIMETARSYGMQRTPYAMLSRGVAGMIGKTLVLTLPGSTKGAKESMQAILPSIKHIFKVQTGMRHE